MGGKLKMRLIVQRSFCILFISLLFVLSNFHIVANQTSNIYSQALEKAIYLHTKGNQDEAKKWFELAASQGSAEAHFRLASSYALNTEGKIYHYSEAAKRGHQEALKSAMDYLFLRANNIFMDPMKAMDIYNQAKKANPSLKLFQEEEIVKVLKMIKEVGSFDAEAFVKRYNIIIPPEAEDAYYVWELAEEASQGGRFGTPDPKLVFQLVSRGGEVPSELFEAVKECYGNWKSNKVEQFKIEKYITSGFGFAYTQHRNVVRKEKENQNRLNDIAKTLMPEKKELVKYAYTAAQNFISLKAQYSEISDKEGESVYYGGTAEAGSIIGFINSQRNEYIELVERIKQGFTPILQISNSDADKELNTIYFELRKVLRQKPKDDKSCLPINLKNMEDIQLAWIKHRDASSRLFSALNPELDELGWKTYLTKIRIEQLTKLYNTATIQAWAKSQ